MGTQDLLERVRGIGNEDPSLKISGAGDPSIACEVDGVQLKVGLKPESRPDRLLLKHSIGFTSDMLGSVPGAGREQREQFLIKLVREIVLQRAGALNVDLRQSTGGLSATLTYPLYQDGFSQQTLHTGLSEIGRTVAQLRATLDQWKEGSENIQKIEAEMKELEKEAEERSRPAPEPSADTPPCRKCGAGLRPGAKYCAGCGSKVKR